MKILHRGGEVAQFVCAPAERIALARDPRQVVLSLAPAEQLFENLLRTANVSLPEHRVRDQVTGAHVALRLAGGGITRGTLRQKSDRLIELASGVVNRGATVLNDRGTQVSSGRPAKGS